MNADDMPNEDELEEAILSAAKQPERPAPWPRLGVYRLHSETNGWMVPSKTTSGSYWRVDWHKDRQGVWFTCTCPRGQAAGRMPRDGRECRHVRLLAEAEAAHGLPPRPIAPPNISALCD